MLGQDYPAIEYLVVDGGSTDGTLDVLRSYGDRLRWTSGPDAGQSDAIGRGFAAATGEYLAWLNSDDLYVSGAVGAAVAALQRRPEAGFVYGRGEFVDRDGSNPEPAAQIGPWDFDRLLRVVNFVLQPATVFRRSAYEEIGGIDVDLQYVMDYDLWLRLGARRPAVYLDRVLTQARVYPETKTSTGGLARMEEMERMIRRNGGAGLPASYRREMWQALRHELADSIRRRQPIRSLKLGLKTAPYAPAATGRRLRQAIAR